MIKIYVSLEDPAEKWMDRDASGGTKCEVEVRFMATTENSKAVKAACEMFIDQLEEAQEGQSRAYLEVGYGELSRYSGEKSVLADAPGTQA